MFYIGRTTKVGEVVAEVRVSMELAIAQGIRSEGEQSDDDDNIVRDFCCGRETYRKG